MDKVKPIETFYNGYRFRSRLEARWAVFFDECNVKWEYEPEGFELKDGTRYLPDFYLTDLDAYVEIKPVGALNFQAHTDGLIINDGREESAKYVKASSDLSEEHIFCFFQGDPIDALFSEHTKAKDGKGLIFMNGVCVNFIRAVKDKTFTVQGERCQECDHFTHPLYSNFIGFGGSKFLYAQDCSEAYVPLKIDSFCITYLEDRKPETVTYLVQSINAGKKARQARFEYGETPKTKTKYLYKEFYK